MDHEREVTQLSFDVGGAEPNIASIKVSGGMATGRQLRKGETIQVVVSSADGEVLAQGIGPVTSIAFKDKRNKYGDVESTERAHTVKIDH
jgi:predicted regulator of Ras-like GTPase activity (Roadblock/LC7/MglB family)